MTGASAVRRVGDHAPVVLLGSPAVSHDCHRGEVTIALGYDGRGQAVTVTISRLEWIEDLEEAARVAFAGGVVQADMHLAVIR